jgi:hypothetical protein
VGAAAIVAGFYRSGLRERSMNVLEAQCDGGRLCTEL